jgi:hypothetical protein
MSRLYVHNKRVATLMTAALGLWMTACTHRPWYPVTGPAIASVKPLQGPFNTVVIISGNGFSTVPAQDSVFFNGLAAVVTNASDSQLTAIVPSLAGTGPLTIKVGDRSIQGPEFTFNYTVTSDVYAGNGEGNFVDGPALTSSFWFPSGIALDDLGNVYVYDLGNGRIREIAPPGSTGSIVSTFRNLHNPKGLDIVREGSPFCAIGLTLASGDHHVPGKTVDTSGNIFIADPVHNTINKITPGGTTVTVAGNGEAISIDGTGLSASFTRPGDITMDAAGNFYVAEKGPQGDLRKMTPQGVVTTLCSCLNNAGGIAVDASGHTFYASEYYANIIEKITIQ